MTILQIDLETYSSVDLRKCGVYRYADAPDFEILLLAYAYDDEPVQVVDLASGETVPGQVLKDLTNPEVVKTAFNANFERTAIASHFGVLCDPKQWRCTAVWSLYLGLPGTLEEVAKVLGLEAQKDMRGKNLIRYFSVPCSPTKANGGRTRNLPHHAPEKWQEFIEYNRQDVVVEREIRKKLSRFPMPEREWQLWELDQRINDQGVQLDSRLFQAAIACDEGYSERLVREAQEITGLENPNSITQLRNWLAERGLEALDGLGKEHMPGLLAQAPDDDTRRVLELRQEMGKTSVNKFQAMERSICSDGKARGLLQFYGANRTGRWAGRLIQVQNLPQNKLENKDLGIARETLQSGEFDLLEILYGPPPFVLSQLIRTAFIPSPGCRFIVSDFSAIEGRVVAWLADEEWKIKVFQDHGKVYEATASRMFGVPFETITKGHENYRYRAFGKVAELACGYQGGVGALAVMDHKKEIDSDEYPNLVKQWREANPNIVQLWYRTEEAAVKAVREKTTVPLAHGVRYRYKAGVLFADLPSGRSLSYVKPRIEPDPNFGKDGLVFQGVDQMKKKWMPQRTYGGKLVENLVQAIARDCLAEALLRLDQAGYKTVMHVHDEVVLDVPKGRGSLEEVVEIMSQPIDWAPGLPLAAAGFEDSFYRKDD